MVVIVNDDKENDPFLESLPPPPLVTTSDNDRVGSTTHDDIYRRRSPTSNKRAVGRIQQRFRRKTFKNSSSTAAVANKSILTPTSTGESTAELSFTPSPLSRRRLNRKHQHSKRSATSGNSANSSLSSLREGDNEEATEERPSNDVVVDDAYISNNMRSNNVKRRLPPIPSFDNIKSLSSSLSSKNNKKEEKTHKKNTISGVVFIPEKKKKKKSKDKNNNNDDSKSIPEVIVFGKKERIPGGEGEEDSIEIDDVSRMTPSEFYWKLQFDDFDPSKQKRRNSSASCSKGKSLLVLSSAEQDAVEVIDEALQEHQEKPLSRRLFQQGSGSISGSRGSGSLMLYKTFNNKNEGSNISIQYYNTNTNTNNNSNAKFNTIMVLWMMMLSIVVVTDTETMWSETVVPQIRTIMMPLYWSVIMTMTTKRSSITAPPAAKGGRRSSSSKGKKRKGKSKNKTTTTTKSSLSRGFGMIRKDNNENNIKSLRPAAVLQNPPRSLSVPERRILESENDTITPSKFFFFLPVVITNFIKVFLQSIRRRIAALFQRKKVG